MFERVLPEIVKPFKLARQNARLTGVVPLSAFENIMTDVPATSGGTPVKVDVVFANGPGGAALLSGSLAASIPHQCQRCLEPVVLEIATDVRVAVYEEEVDESRLPEGYEPVLVEDEQVRLVDLIEQELILAAPIIPLHDSCEGFEVPEQQIEAEETSEESGQKESPFAGLSELLANSRQPRKK